MTHMHDRWMETAPPNLLLRDQAYAAIDDHFNLEHDVEVRRQLFGGYQCTIALVYHGEAPDPYLAILLAHQSWKSGQ